MLKSCERGILPFFAFVKFTFYRAKAQRPIVNQPMDITVIILSNIAKTDMIINSMWKSFYCYVLLHHCLIINRKV